MRKVLKIDENGFLVFGCDLYIKDDEPTPQGYTDIPLPVDMNGEQLPFYRPRWTGTEWIEDVTQTEIDELNNQPVLPTQEERIDMLESMILMMMEG